MTDQLLRFIDWLIYQLKLLPHRPRLVWNKLWVRKDEFHHSLDMDARAMLRMDQEDQEAYLRDLVRRREIAHQRDLEEPSVHNETGR